MLKDLDLFSFSDYRKYISAWLDGARKARTSNLSALASSIAVHTSFLAHVLSGSKNLSFEQAAELSEILKHSTLEREYFFALLHQERAGSEKLRRYWSEKVQSILSERGKIRSRVGKHHELSMEERALFYSSWIYVAAFVATAIDDGQTLSQIADRLAISHSRAEEVLTFLVQTGVCKRQGSVYKMGPSTVFIPDDSPLIIKHHSNWRLRAIQKMDTRESSELFYTCPMSMSVEDLARVREIFAKGIQASMEICNQSPAQEIYCLNIDLFRSG